MVSRSEGPARARRAQTELGGREPSRPGVSARRANTAADMEPGASQVHKPRRGGRDTSASSSGGKGLLSLPRVGSETDFAYQKQWSCHLCR
eukprot:1019949-Alexandrium_andersonii.AAC.1